MLAGAGARGAGGGAGRAGAGASSTGAAAGPSLRRTASTVRSRRCRSETSCSYAAGRWCRWTVSSSMPRRCSTSRTHGRSRPVERTAAERSGERCAQRRRAVPPAVAVAAESTTPGSCGWSRRRGRGGRRSPGWPTGTRSPSCLTPSPRGRLALGGEALRALAVLVVALPARSSSPRRWRRGGISRRERRAREGGRPEALARAEILLLDKTGTVTTGRPRLRRVEVFTDLPPDALLRLAASLEQVPLHVFAAAVGAAAPRRGLTLAFPEEVEERPGAGIRGRIDGRTVAIGRLDWIDASGHGQATVRRLRRECALEGSTPAFSASTAIRGGAHSRIVRADSAVTPPAAARHPAGGACHRRPAGVAEVVGAAVMPTRCSPNAIRGRRWKRWPSATAA